MPHYVVFFHLTHQGLDHLRGSPDRVDAAKKTFSQHGAKVKDFYSMMGQYDSMFIVEAPNDDVMAQLALTVGAQGNVRTETHRAFNDGLRRQRRQRCLLGGVPDHRVAPDESKRGIPGHTASGKLKADITPQTPSGVPVSIIR